MEVIYKYPFDVNDVVEIEMFEGAVILSCQTQHNQPTIWALVDTGNLSEMRKFKIIGTGHHQESMDGLEYIDTFQMLGGDLIWHLFEVKEAHHDQQ